MSEQKVKILIDDPSGRFTKGEVGTLEVNDFDKYDYLVRLPDVFDYGITMKRYYYFYKDEVELLP